MKLFQAQFTLENQKRRKILRVGENLCSGLYVRQGNKGKTFTPTNNHIQLHSGKCKEIYLSISYVTRRLLTVVEIIK
jgi:hypothetical protein